MARNEIESFDFENRLFGFEKRGDSTDVDKIRKNSGLDMF